MNYRLTIIIIGISVICSHITFAEPNMKEGQWEITAKTEMRGMPMAMPPVKFTQCLTQQGNVPQNKELYENCQLLSSNVEGNTVTWVVQCNDEGKSIKSTGKITYKGNSFDGVVKTTIEDLEMTQIMTGKYIGDCK